MKISLLVVCCLSLALIGKVTTSKDSNVNRIKLLYEMFYRVHDRFTLKNCGKEFIRNKRDYTNWTNEMDHFFEDYRNGRMLPRGEFFGGMIEEHAKEAHILFLFFYNAKTPEIMMKNVCWARVHMNEGVFFQAVNMARFYKDSLQAYDLAQVYEVFPEYFLSWKYVLEANKFNGVETSNVPPARNTSKPWQWWRAMGLDDNWHAEHEFILRDTIYKRLNDELYWDTLKGLKFWWLPADYTREFEKDTELTKMSYFTEDIEWNSYWYYLNVGYAPEFSAQTILIPLLNKWHRGEFWLFTVQQLMTRYYFERLSHKLGEIPQFSWEASTNVTPHETYLLTFASESLRSNHGNDLKSELFVQARNKFEKIEKAIDLGYYELKNGTNISLLEPEGIEILGNLLQSNVDAVDAQESHFNWYRQAMTSFSDWKQFERPNLLLNFETMLRDPFSYSFHQKLADLYHKLKAKLPPYTQDQIAAEGISIEHIEVSGFETFYDLVDFDVSSLNQHSLKFDKDEFRQENVLLARQMRLNHKTLKYNITIRSDKYQNVIVHIFLGPKYDEHGKALNLAQNRKNLFSLDQYKCQVLSGLNKCSQSSDDALWTGNDRRVLAERYHFQKYVAAGFSYEPKNYDWEDPCKFPNRLILPRGWEEGMPMRLFVVVEKEPEAENARQQHCERRASTKPFGYPFDRVITNENIFSMPNIRFLDVNITHTDSFATYFKDYKNLGKFDYNFLNGYYHKNIDYKKYQKAK